MQVLPPLQKFFHPDYTCEHFGSPPPPLFFCGGVVVVVAVVWVVISYCFVKNVERLFGGRGELTTNVFIIGFCWTVLMLLLYVFAVVVTVVLVAAAAIFLRCTCRMQFNYKHVSKRHTVTN